MEGELNKILAASSKCRPGSSVGRNGIISKSIDGNVTINLAQKVKGFSIRPQTANASK
jgi:hypothetical protein